jgi:hypothetical protein
MVRVVWRTLAIVLCAAAFAASPLQAQTTDQKAVDAAKGEAKDGAGRIDEIADADRNMTGPAARPECRWLGQRAVGLMAHDDLDTAFRHLDLYDRFGCPGEHIQISFRCVVRQGDIEQKDQKATDLFNNRVRACWINPASPPASATSAAAEKPVTK